METKEAQVEAQWAQGPKMHCKDLEDQWQGQELRRLRTNLDKEVNHFLSLMIIPEEEALKMVQMNQVDEGPNVGAGFLLRNFI